MNKMNQTKRERQPNCNHINSHTHTHTHSRVVVVVVVVFKTFAKGQQAKRLTKTLVLCKLRLERRKKQKKISQRRKIARWPRVNHWKFYSCSNPSRQMCVDGGGGGVVQKNRTIEQKYNEMVTLIFSTWKASCVGSRNQKLNQNMDLKFFTCTRKV